MGCDPYWEDYVRQDESGLSVFISTSTCDRLLESCTDFADMQSQLASIVEDSVSQMIAIIHQEMRHNREINVEMFGFDDVYSLIDYSKQGCSADAECSEFICSGLSGFAAEFTSAKQVFVDEGIDTFEIGTKSIEQDVVYAASGANLIGALLAAALMLVI